MPSVPALILGYKDELNDEIKLAYTNTGAMHVLAVSGLHVGMIWGFVALVLSWVPIRKPFWKWTKLVITIASLWLFALITGASPSVLRAATMFSFVIVGNSIGRSGSIYNTLAASAFLLLLINPFLIKEVGFQLSYLAVIGIVYFQPKIYRLWYIKNKAGDFLWKLSSVAIAAQITTFPLSLYYFHQLPLYFWLSGLVVVPFAFWILGSGVLLMISSALLPFLAKFIGLILNGIIWLMNALIFLIEQIPFGLLSGIWIGSLTLIFLYFLLFFISISINTKKISWLLRAMVFGILISGIFAFRGVKILENKEMVFYHIPKKTYVEFFDSDDVISFGDVSIDPKKLSFATKEYHFFKGVKSKTGFHFGFENKELKNWMLLNGFVQFYDKKIAFLRELPSLNPTQKIEVDYILIRKNAKFDLGTLVQNVDFQMIVLDGGMKRQSRLDWIRSCRENEIPFHDTYTKGALIIPIN